MWETLIRWFVLALIWLYRVFGSSEWSFALSIVMMTIVVRVLTLPFTLPSQRSMKKNAAKMQALQPEMEKLKKKFRNDPQKLQQAQLELYQQYGINPLSSMTGCLPLLIQLPIIWAFYQSISRALANQPGQMIVLSKYLAGVPGFMKLVPLPSKFLWFDLGRPDMLVLPILVAASTWLQQKLTMANTPPSTDPQAAQMNQSMMITMPLMFGFLAMQMPAGLSIYFIASAIVGIGVQWLTDKLVKDGGSTEALVIKTSPASPMPRQEPPKTKSGRRKRGYKTQ
mgnify:CR=1 FL=1